MLVLHRHYDFTLVLQKYVGGAWLSYIVSGWLNHPCLTPRLWTCLYAILHPQIPAYFASIFLLVHWIQSDHPKGEVGRET